MSMNAPTKQTWTWTPNRDRTLSPLMSTEFLVQFEEDRWEPGRWRNLSSYPGHLNSVILQLAPFVNYQFRVVAVNSVGQSEPSVPSPQYKTSGAGETRLVRPEVQLSRASQMFWH